MTLKIFHTGDLHLGMRFNSYAESIRKVLREARFQSLEGMVNKANELETDLFVVAGDLFDNLTVAKSDIEKTIKILDRFAGELVLVLPGNHDYYNEESDLWKTFNSYRSEKILLLNDNRIYSLDSYGLEVDIYPAYCENKHSATNNLGWIKECESIEEDRLNLGLAHGALEGLSADIEGKYYYMTMDELEAIPVDLWLLGHTHVQYPVKDKVYDQKIYNAGTPEPDGLNFKSHGAAWFIKASKDSLEAESIHTGLYKFMDLNIEIREDEDIYRLKDELLKNNMDKHIVRLNLSGRLSEDLYSQLNKIYQELENELFYLIIEDENLGVRINEEIIKREFTKGSFPYEFLNKLKDDEEALQIAYEIIRRD